MMRHRVTRFEQSEGGWVSLRVVVGLTLLLVGVLWLLSYLIKIAFPVVIAALLAIFGLMILARPSRRERIDDAVTDVRMKRAVREAYEESKWAGSAVGRGAKKSVANLSEGGVGDRTYAPTAADELPADVRLGVGSMVLDLSRFPQPVAARTVAVSVGSGSLVVRIPSDCGVEAICAVDIGQLVVIDDVRDGAHLSHTYVQGDDAPLTLELSVGIGRLAVERA